MAPEPSRLTRQVTFVLLALASTATEIAAVDSRPVVESLAWALAWVGTALVLGRFVPAPKAGSRVPPTSGLLALVGLTALPFLVEPARRLWTGDGYPLELQMVFALRNLGLGLAALGRWPLCPRLAAVVSLFLMLFSVSMTDHGAVMVLLGLYGAAGSVWLMLAYWTGLRKTFAAAESAATLEVQPGRERLPWAAVLVAVALVASALGLVAVGPRRAAAVLAQWLPTSGGTGDRDPFARGGLNDGDEEVKGASARSTGTVESDTFLDSPLPSLYDMFNDLYGEPFKPRDRERAVPLDSQARANESRKPPADNLRPGREFPTTRKGPRRPRDPSGRAARALFEVQGRTPLHVRVTAFDTFDGVAWQEATIDLRTCLLDREPDSGWIKVQERTPANVFAGPETHQFKITTSFGSLVPAPPHLTRFRVGRVDRIDFFAWGQERVLRMAARKLPSGVCVETEARTVDPRLLNAVQFPDGASGTRPEYVRLPGRLDPKVTALARAWAGERPRGWPQLDAVLRRLRSDYALDPAARVPDDCTDPLAHFLLQSRRGPDYQFATAAAVLLRELGYPTRLVSGFYVSPDHYDPQARHTPVVAEDLHFWAEAMLPSGDWLVLEATPGYEVLGPNLPWTDRLLAALAAALAWAGRHAPELTLAALAAAALWWRRHELLDSLAVACWRLAAPRSWQGCVHRAVRLLERRGRWAGRPRPPSHTPPRWLRGILPEGGGLTELACMAEWAAYGPGLAPPWGEAEVRSVCRRAIELWTLRRWRRECRPAVLGGIGREAIHPLAGVGPS